MSAVRTLLSCVVLAAAALVVSACSSDGGSAGGPASSGGQLVGSGSGESWDDGEPVQGNFSVTWRNLNPANPPASASLVNESSEIGQKLKSGRGSSSEIRVITDAQMGGLIDQLRKLGFFDHATDGLGLDSLPDLPGRRGIVVLMQDGRSKGLMLTTNLGPGPIPQTYRDCKYLVLLAHSQAQGAEVRASIGAPDESLLTAPKPKFHRP